MHLKNKNILNSLGTYSTSFMSQLKRGWNGKTSLDPAGCSKSHTAWTTSDNRIRRVSLTEIQRLKKNELENHPGQIAN